MTNKEWFKQAEFGLMIHFGLYSLIGGEWKGARTPFLGEWAQSYFQIPNSEYCQLAGAFNPVLFCADDWVRLAKEAGMQYIVVTSKHHEGFALFQSEYDTFNCVNGAPFGRDLIEEVAEACQKYNMKMGLYYSQELDWHEPDGGGYHTGHTCCGCMSWTNDWDFPDNEKKNYSRLFESKIKIQLQEILTKYGELALIWFDTPHEISDSQSIELYQIVKKYQPNCLVNSRISRNEAIGDYRSWDDNEIPTECPQCGLYETPATLNDTWGYKPYDDNWKSAQQVLTLKKHLNAYVINYLLNVGPDPLGRIPAPAQRILREVGRSMR